MSIGNHFNLPQKVFVLLSDDGCHHCIEFAPIWDKLSSNGELKSKYYFRHFESHGLVDPTVPRRERRPFAPCFDAYRNLPTMFITSVSKYEKNFNINSGTPIDFDTPIVSEVIYPGNALRDYESIKAFLLKNR